MSHDPHAPPHVFCFSCRQVQRTHRLCAARDLSEHDIVSRVMRKENYLIGMLNKVGKDECAGLRPCSCNGSA